MVYIMRTLVDPTVVDSQSGAVTFKLVFHRALTIGKGYPESRSSSQSPVTAMFETFIYDLKLVYVVPVAWPEVRNKKGVYEMAEHVGQEPRTTVLVPLVG
jgi:hypothetical protein